MKMKIKMKTNDRCATRLNFRARIAFWGLAALVGAAFLCVPTERAVADGFGISLNFGNGSFNFSTGFAVPAPAPIVVAPSPAPSPAPLPPPAPIYYRPAPYRPAPRVAPPAPFVPIKPPVIRGQVPNRSTRAPAVREQVPTARRTHSPVASGRAIDPRR